jgi:Tfp pilus assembly protein PilF
MQNTVNKSNLKYWSHLPQTYIKQGLSYLNQGFTEIAIRCFEIALIKQPSNKKAQHHLSTLLK